MNKIEAQCMPEYVDYESAALVNEIINSSEKRDPDVLRFPRKEREEFARKVLLNIGRFEASRRIPPTDEMVAKVSAIWEISGIGSYTRPVDLRHSVYKLIPWIQYSDRNRMNYAVWLARKIAETKSRGGGNSTQGVREMFERFAPIIIYNSERWMNEDLAKAVSESPMVPAEKVHIVTGEIRRTIDQFQVFDLPRGMSKKPGDRIGIVTHAPHLVRFLHMLNHFQSEFHVIPDGMEVQVFPMASPVGAKREYAIMETRGLIFYHFVSGLAASEPFPYHLN